MNPAANRTCPKCGATCANENLEGFSGLCLHCMMSQLLPGGADDERAGPNLAGTRVDRYTLLEKIGVGGMGSVWKARQEEPVQREVAFKLIKLGMDTRETVARFEAERQVLAVLDHPHIANIYDAGSTETGRPYYVMELVDGLPVTDYCREHGLSTAERLALFRQICRAVAYAHEQGVVHRDLKPTNILVADHHEPRLKLIDFGIAKAAGPAFAENTLVTRMGSIVGTPGYMSPEQADGGAEIDGRADVYALGALLYEMLSGEPPFTTESLEHAGMLEVIRIIREEVPPKPSTRLRSAGAVQTRQVLRIASDLDWIALKALAKDPAQRYDSPAGLIDDIDRHLRSETVSATAPSLATRAAKFILRHRGACLTTAVAILVAAATMALSSLVPRPPPPDAEAGPVIDLTPGPAIDLWKLLDPERDGTEPGMFRVEGDVVECQLDSSKNQFVEFPGLPVGSYRFEMQVTRNPVGPVLFELPVGQHAVFVRCRPLDMMTLQVGRVKEFREVPDLAVAPFHLQEHAMVCTVINDPESDAISVTIAADGSDVLSWSGQRSDLGAPPEVPLTGVVIRFANTPAAVRSPRLQPLGKDSGVILKRPADLGKLDDPAVRKALRTHAARELLRTPGARLDIVENGVARPAFYPADIPIGPFEAKAYDTRRVRYVPGHLKPLLTLQDLGHLKIIGPVGDADLAALGTHPRLESLVLNNAKVTTEGIKQASGFPALRALRLSYCPRLEGALDLSHHPGLASLHLIYCKGVTDLRLLAANPNLRSIELYGAGVDDQGFRFPTPPPKLDRVVIEKCHMTAATLPYFATIPTLKTLVIMDRFVTHEAAEAFQDQRPDCRLVYRIGSERIDLPPR